MATLSEMSVGVADTAALLRQHLTSLEEMTYRQGVQPGPDLAFAGLRVAIARSEAAAQFLASLAPYQEELEPWLVDRIEKRLKAAGTPAELV